jgi:hypothetical protein
MLGTSPPSVIHRGMAKIPRNAEAEVPGIHELWQEESTQGAAAVGESIR